jgi:hypothetical protein
MNIDKLVIELVESYNHSGLIPINTGQRELFLCLVAFILKSHELNIPKNKYSELLLTIENHNSVNNDVCSSLDSTINNSSLQAIHRIFKELQQHIVNTSCDFQKLKEELDWLYSSINAEKITQPNMVILYDKLQQRLQKMNDPDILSSDFIYSNLPFELSELIYKLSGKESFESIYDPLAKDAELTTFLTSLASTKKAYIANLGQTETYIRHKLLLSDVMEYCIADAIENTKFNITTDFAFTYIDPMMSSALVKKKESDLNSVEDSKSQQPLEYPEHGYIRQIYDSLSEDGAGIIFVGKGPLHRKIETENRNQLLALNAVDAVIELPTKIVTPKTPTLYALILKKNRTNDKVTFIDASENYNHAGRKSTLVNIDSIVKNYQATMPSDTCIRVNVDTLVANDCSLVVSNYISPVTIENTNINEHEVRDKLQILQKKNDNLIKELTTHF